LTYTHHHDRIHDPANSIQRPSTCMYSHPQPLALLVTFSAYDYSFSLLSSRFTSSLTPCFHDHFSHFFSPSVSIFACLPLWLWFPPVYQPTIDHITTRSIGFSLIHLALILTGSTYLEIHGNPKQHRIGKHLDIFLFRSFDLDSKIKASCTTFTLALSSSLYSPKYNSTNVL